MVPSQAADPLVQADVGHNIATSLYDRWSPSDRDLQRADGCCRIVLSGSENGTRIEDVFERSPIRVMFPRNGHCVMEEAVLINTAGGIAGGDRLECSVVALPDASIAVTSQAAEKIYGSLCDAARVVTR